MALSRLKKMYVEEIVPNLMNKLQFKSIMQVPKIIKIVVSKGVGAAVADKKLIEHAIDELTLITGQKAIATLSKKDVASFKLRKGMPIGAKVTLRGEKMYEFLDRLITAALPRVRDFQGLKVGGFDGRGNYTLGISEQIIFPEIDIDKVNKISGMDITIVTSSQTDQEAKSLLKEMGLPFNNKKMFKEEITGNVSNEVKIVNEEVSTEEKSVNETSSEEKPLEEIPSKEIHLGETPTEERPVEEVSSVKQVPTEEENLKNNKVKDKKL